VHPNVFSDAICLFTASHFLFSNEFLPLCHSEQFYTDEWHSPRLSVRVISTTTIEMIKSNNALFTSSRRISIGCQEGVGCSVISQTVIRFKFLMSADICVPPTPWRKYECRLVRGDQ
jgi:hypothetical protein